MAVYKNVANQKIRVLALDADGNPYSGDAANITATVSLDSGAPTATDDTNPVEIGTTGAYSFDLTQEETDADGITLFPVSSTDDITLEVVDVYTNDVTSLVWDEVLSGSTHNIPTSAGRRLRQLASAIMYDGVSQGPGTSGNGNQIQLDAGATATSGAFDPSSITLFSQTGEQQTRLILEYDGPTKIATVDRNWKVEPVSGDEFIITDNPGREHVNEGAVVGATANTLQLNELASDQDDAYCGQIAFIRSGYADDSARVAIAYNGATRTVTVDRPWVLIPAVGDGYAMLPSGLSSIVAVDGTAIGSLSDLWEFNIDLLDDLPDNVTTPKEMLQFIRYAIQFGGTSEDGTRTICDENGAEKFTASQSVTAGKLTAGGYTDVP